MQHSNDRATDPITTKVRNASDMLLADKVMMARKEGDPWKVIDLLVNAWAQRYPAEERVLRIDIEEQRKDLADKKFGTTSEGKDFERRLTLIFPYKLQALLRTQYSASELNFDNKFYREFLKRYPAFQLPEKM